ncbi:MAG: iron chelate uptake ABC transporter family permease subunit [Phycisphaerales bacterium JB063]
MTPTLIALLQISPDQALEPWTLRWLTQTLCTMLVGLTCGLLGCFVVLRRMALIGDALSHAVLPGVVLAFLFTGDTQPIPLLVGATASGIITTVLISLVVRTSRTKEDSSIGIVFTAMFAVGIVLLSGLESSTHFDLTCFLFGEPMAIGPGELWMMGIICPVVIGAIAVMYHRLKLISFDPTVAAAMGVSVVLTHYLLMGLLSVTVVAGLKTTGVILVVAMVITPASAAYQLTNRFNVMLILSAVFGALSAGVGMSVAFVFNSPTGPAMVLVAGGIFALSVLFSPNHGWVFDRLRRLRLARHVAAEDVLKALYRLGPQPEGAWVEPVGSETGLSPRLLLKTIARLRDEAVVAFEAGKLALTEAGTRHARELVRSHRLWETYLVNEAGLTAEEVHDSAERLEHAHELSDALFKALGEPDQDPHGSEIPRAEDS